MSIINCMDGHTALLWLGLKYSTPFSISSPPISDAWGQIRFGRVTAVMVIKLPLFLKFIIIIIH